MKTLYSILLVFFGVSIHAQFFINSSTTITVEPSSTLYSAENFENEGTLTLKTDGNTQVFFDGNYNNTNGTVNFNNNAFRIGSGTADSNGTVDLDFNTTGETVERMIVDKTGGTANGQSGTMEITTSLTMEDVGVLDAEDEVILISNATNTAVVEDSNPNASAKVTVQRYFPANRAFRFVSPSVNSSGTIHRDWQEGATGWNDTAVDDGLGIHITGLGLLSGSGHSSSPGDGDQFNGLDWQPSGNPSLFEYGTDWSAVTVTDDNNSSTDIDQLKVQKPYLVMVRGARVTGGTAFDITNNGSPATETILRAKGDLLFGNTIAAPINTGGDAFSFVANPYHSQVDFNALTSSNLTPFIYYWDPNVNTRGGYVSFEKGVAGSASIIDPQTGSPSSDVNQYIQPGQAFFVQNMPAVSGSLSFSEVNKVNTTPQTGVFSDNTLPMIAISLSSSDIDNNMTLLDGVKMLFDSNYSTQATPEDAPRFVNSDETLGIVQDDSVLMYDKRPEPTGEQIIPLSLTQYRNENYQFYFTKEITDVNVVLEDTYTDVITPIVQGTTYNFSIDESIPESIDDTRFNLIFNPTTFGINDNKLFGMSLSPNPATSEITFQFSSNLTEADSTVELFDITGRLISSQILNDTLTVNVSTLADGVYVAKVTNNGKVWNKKFIKE